MKIYISRSDHTSTKHVENAVEFVREFLIKEGFPGLDIEIEWRLYSQRINRESVIKDCDFIFFIKDIWNNCFADEYQYEDFTVGARYYNKKHAALYKKNDGTWQIYNNIEMRTSCCPTEQKHKWAHFETTGSSVKDMFLETFDIPVPGVVEETINEDFGVGSLGTVSEPEIKVGEYWDKCDTISDSEVYIWGAAKKEKDNMDLFPLFIR